MTEPELEPIPEDRLYWLIEREEEERERKEGEEEERFFEKGAAILRP
jgi:hypothetical protein